MSARRWNVAEAFARAAERSPEKVALVGARANGPGSAREQLTFGELARRVRACAAGWARLGVGRGERVLIMAHPSLDFLVGVLSLQWIGAVPVFLDGGLPVERILRLVAEADAAALLASAEVLQLRAAALAPFQSVRVVVATGVADAAADASVAELCGVDDAPPAAAPLAPDDLVGIVFTSGSTGLPKGVEFTAEMAFAGVDWLAATGLGADDVYLAILPSHLIGSLMLGMTCVLPDIDVSRPGAADPRVIVDQVLERDVTFTIGPPSLWTLVAEHCARDARTMPGLRVVAISGAAVAPKLLRLVRAAVPNGEVRTPLGATEGSPITDIGAREVLGEIAEATARGAGVCVGRCLAGHQLRVIEITDRPLSSWSQVTELPSGAIGELVMSGPVVSRRYFRRPAETAASKILDEHGQIWHRLGDCGYLDDQGRVWYCGRIAHIATRGGQPVYSVQVEEVFNDLPGVARTALVQPRGEATPLVLVVEREAVAPGAPGSPASLDALRRRIDARAREREISLDHVLFYPGPLPVDARHNSKIERAELAQWAAAELPLAAIA
ncbi:MAG: AMP-binding protein [Kofleriaceae bacterium]